MIMVKRSSIVGIFLLIVVFAALQNWLLRTSNSGASKSLVANDNIVNIEDDMLILYNRIPKTGSTSFMSILYELHDLNKFSVAFVNVSSSSHRFLFLDQYLFARNITTWKIRKPAIYSGHFPFLDFTKLGMKQPIFINIIRKPLERVVSHYYFIRYGDTFLPKKIRSRQGDKTTFDECVHRRNSECSVDKLWLQIPYFCGSDDFCWEPGNKIALEQAKRNVVDKYFLVGVMDNIENFIEILESSLPRFFKGALTLYRKNGGIHIRKTKVKKLLLAETVKFFEATKIWKMENEFYEFLETRFSNIYNRFVSSKGKVHISYNKLRPVL